MFRPAVLPEQIALENYSGLTWEFGLKLFLSLSHNPLYHWYHSIRNCLISSCFQHPKMSAAWLFSSCRAWCPFLWRPSKVRIAVSIPSSFLRRFPRMTTEVGAWYSLSQTWYHSLLTYLYSNIINNSLLTPCDILDNGGKTTDILT